MILKVWPSQSWGLCQSTGHQMGARPRRGRQENVVHNIWGANQKGSGRSGWNSSQFSETRQAVGQGPGTGYWPGDSIEGSCSVNLRFSILLFILLLSILLRGRKLPSPSVPNKVFLPQALQYVPSPWGRALLREAVISMSSRKACLTALKALARFCSARGPQTW